MVWVKAIGVDSPLGCRWGVGTIQRYSLVMWSQLRKADRRLVFFFFVYHFGHWAGADCLSSLVLSCTLIAFHLASRRKDIHLKLHEYVELKLRLPSYNGIQAVARNTIV
ncbi:hypothetical protein BP00DRAFT_43461 [Aspergillus indologenus CBS 114.80]|uniref:Uncharacterized protein n=1 Tax=Aspergillus indologenus CBS 114.80 TaxID=1450541 RepID=A0A2V5IKK1_9EURO|nr:hypothetical protein BP00DRAFT_43461 [Aspergillus indologenus CBS 114.80]